MADDKPKLTLMTTERGAVDLKRRRALEDFAYLRELCVKEPRFVDRLIIAERSRCEYNDRFVYTWNMGMLHAVVQVLAAELGLDDEQKQYIRNYVNEIFNQSGMLNNDFKPKDLISYGGRLTY